MWRWYSTPVSTITWCSASSEYRHSASLRRVFARARSTVQSGRPPARHQQQPGADRPVEAGEPQIRAGESGRETVDPVSGRIGDASGALAHLLPSGVPVRVSKVPRPVLMSVESIMGALSASLNVGPAGRCGAAATWQTLVRISLVLA